MTTQALTPRALQRLERREEIVDLAMSAVLERGIGGLSVNKLARSIGFTPGALYRYFDSKDALVAELVRRLVDDISARLVQAAPGSEPAQDLPLRRLLAMIGSYVAYAREQPQAFGLIGQLLADPNLVVGDAGHAGEVAGHVAGLLVELTKQLVQAADRGQLDDGDPVQRALALFAGVQGALMLRKQERHPAFPIDADLIATHLVRSLLRGWGAPDEALDEPLEESLDGPIEGTELDDAAAQAKPSTATND